MARPTIAAAQTALDNLYNVLTSGNTPVRLQRSGAAIDALGSVASAIKTAMTGAALTVTDTHDADLQAQFVYPNIDFLMTDAADASVAAFFIGELLDALGRAPRVGDAFEVQGNQDTTDNALAAAKTTDPTDGDIFIVSNTGTPAVVYAGNDGELAKALGRRAEIGDVFEVSGTGDTTDNALEAAKLVVEAVLPLTTAVIPVELTVTNDQDADLAAFYITTGELRVALGRDAAVNDEFVVLGAGDLTDDAMDDAKIAEAVTAQVADILLNDATDADISTLLSSSGELGLAIGRALIEGDVFEVQADDDTTDNALQAAKSGAPANGDMFRVLSGDVTVTYIGTATAIPVLANDRFRVTNISTEALIFLGNDAEDTTITTALLSTGDIGSALGRDSQVGDKFVTMSKGDTNDNALVSAKGSALTAGGGDIFVVVSSSEVSYQATLTATVEDGDVFEVTAVSIGNEAVAYLGTGALNISSVKLARQ